MSSITKDNTTEANYVEIKDLAKHRFLDGLKEIGRGFWAHTEETGEMDTKPFDGWQ